MIQFKKVIGILKIRSEDLAVKLEALHFNT